MRDVDPIALGRRIAVRREKLGISQKELGADVGMSQQGIDNIEHGSSKRPRALREIAGRLATTQEWLLWKEGPEEVGDPQAMTEKELVDNYHRLPDARRKVFSRMLRYAAGG